jgi:hypothetical protein
MTVELRSACKGVVFFLLYQSCEVANKPHIKTSELDKDPYTQVARKCCGCVKNCSIMKVFFILCG